jgi:hypothetical protein
MPTPTDDRRDLLTVIAYMKAAPGKEAELKAELEAGMVGDLIDENGLTITRLHRVA